ncbi:MAG: hypothetical protein JRF28_01375 [Deltaproteobacteria bacterium]|nr:hypothetical protein [Deltaproteobacteria bacterium]
MPTFFNYRFLRTTRFLTTLFLFLGRCFVAVAREPADLWGIRTCCYGGKSPACPGRFCW